ncbi:hypothetical protein V6N11_000043 [Hibiscus sabdariffa]|uniref:Uncharacterized protein n=1 Tax=Hibiscus sabdariffa TaxID=183260 RepID=A0ABR2NNG4_9ROSI
MLLWKRIPYKSLSETCGRAVAINGGSLRSTSTGKQRACGSNDANVNVRSALTDQQHTCGLNAENYNVRSVSTGLQNGDVRGACYLQLYADAVLPLDTAPVTTNNHAMITRSNGGVFKPKVYSTILM